MFNKKLLQFYNTADSGMGSLETLLDGMDTSTTPAPEPASTPTPTPTPTPEPEPPTNTNSEPQNQNSKMNYAFGQMRQEVATYKGMLTKLADAAGIEYKDEKELIEKLNSNALEQKARTSNIPVDILKRLDMLEQSNAAYAQQQRQSATMVGFQKLADTYNLTNDDLLEFAKQLDEKGMNPFENDVDIDSAYKTINFDKIVAQKVEQAVQEALKKSSVADTNSSTPNSNQGSAGTGDAQKISTVSQLSDMLDKVKL